MSNCRLCYWTHVARVGLEHIGVVGWEDGCSSPYYGAERVVHLLGFGLVDGGLEDWALCRGGGSAGDRWVRGEVVVMVCCCSYDRTLRWLISTNMSREVEGHKQSGHPLTSRRQGGLVGAHRWWFR
jgi:hypothetical protein